MGLRQFIKHVKTTGKRCRLRVTETGRREAESVVVQYKTKDFSMCVCEERRDGGKCELCTSKEFIPMIKWRNKQK